MRGRGADSIRLVPPEGDKAGSTCFLRAFKGITFILPTHLASLTLEFKIHIRTTLPVQERSPMTSALVTDSGIGHGRYEPSMAGS